MRAFFKTPAYNVWSIFIVPILLWNLYTISKFDFKEFDFFFTKTTIVEGVVSSVNKTKYKYANDIVESNPIYLVRFEYDFEMEEYEGLCYSSDILEEGRIIKIELSILDPTFSKVIDGSFNPYGVNIYFWSGLILLVLLIFILTDKFEFKFGKE